MTKPITSTKESGGTPFLDRLASSERAAGVYIFRGFLSSTEADDAMEQLNRDDFPWCEVPEIGGEFFHLPSYIHRRPAEEIEGNVGLECLEHLCRRIETEFDSKVSKVYCNRFQDPKHHITWHTDTYGKHILVLTLGAKRTVQFRDKKTRKVESLVPESGDLYLMPLSLNYTHKHRVCPPDFENLGTRLSFVFFFSAPAYAQEFKITKWDKIRGLF